jgi:predicted O-methyltransferase YrrM
MSLGGTAAYRRPGMHASSDLVLAAVTQAERLDIAFCVRPEIGQLLAVLARGLPAGSVVGETGTGTGAGLAWMVEAAPSSVRFISYEIDPDRAQAAQSVFREHHNVGVICGDASELFAHGPFDLLVHDGGPGSGKSPGSTAIDPAQVLRLGEP